MINCNPHVKCADFYFGKVNMLCAIYKSLVMMFNLLGRKALYYLDCNEVLETIKCQGFYLQIAKQDDGLFNSLSEIK